MTIEKEVCVYNYGSFDFESWRIIKRKGTVEEDLKTCFNVANQAPVIIEPEI